MADVKISELPNGSTLTGTEEVPVVQSGVTVQTTTQDIANLASGGSLAGDVTGPLGANTVVFVGGQTAANVATATVAANAATPADVPNTIVSRDLSGNFAANNITANLLGNATTATSATTAGSTANFTGSLAGDVTGTQSATAI